MAANSKAARAALLIAKSPRDKWFGNSVVREADGSPRVVYHATGADISSFEPGTHFGTRDAAHARLAEVKGWDRRARDERGVGHAFNVMPVHLSIENPLRVSDAEASDHELLTEAIRRKKYPGVDYNMAARKGPIRALTDAGYDGLVYSNRIEDKGRDSYVNFHPQQVKSAIGNSGEYDPNSRDIVRKHGGVVDPYKRAKKVVPTTGRYKDGGDVWDRFHRAVSYARGGRAEIDDKLLGALKRPGSGYVPAKNKPGTVKIPGYGEVEARPIDAIESSAAKYMKARGTHIDNEFSPFNEEFAKRVADAFERMEHNPRDPKVKRAYDALIDETLAQYHAAKDTGIDFKFLKPGEKDPYAASPSLGYADIVNKGKLHVFPTEAGFGSSAKDVSDNPLLKRVGKIGDLNNATVNDAFRIIHDVYGHYGPGNPFFRAPGEERAFRQHAQMFSPEARKAAATETRGQNSWVNYGPFGEKNRKAIGADTVFADQKVGLMPDEFSISDTPAAKADGGAIDPARQAKIREHNELLQAIRPLAAKGGLTATEAKRFRQMTSRLTDLKFDLAKPGSVEKVLPSSETMNAMHPEAVVAAHTDYHRSRPIYRAVASAAAGVGFNQNTAVDDIMDGKHPDVTPKQFYDNFQSTRDALRKHHGDVMTLYRSEGRQMPKATKNWATTPEFASQFGGNVISQQIPVDNIVGANVMTNGKYHELIVGQPPKETFKDGGSVITPEMIAPATAAPKIVAAAKARPEPTGEDHPAWIPTRLVTSKKAQSQRGDIVDMKSLRDAPALYEKNIDLLRAYPNMRESTSKRDHKAVEQEMIRHVKDNLLDLHDRVPEDIRNRSKLWYDGARRITDDWMKTYDLPDHSVAGALAALSPQKDWYQNVSLAKRVLDSMRGDPDAYQSKPFSTDMEDTWRGRPSLNKPVYEGLINTLRGKSLGALDKLDMSPAERATLKAMWIRMHDETHNDPSHPIITPEGGFGELVKTDKGENAKVGWGSLGEIAKAVRSVESANDPAALSQLMGERHKVRNFYNNIISPNSRHGDVTIDTHAVAAGLMRPLSGNSLEVAHNFANHPGVGLPAAGGSAITGAQGLYPLYADAYRQAAKERGILPREMQSITWEAIRGLFPDTFKTKANSAKVDAVWHQYRKGKLSQAEARDKIHEIAGGIRNPTWVTGRDEANRGAPDAGALPEPVVHGPPTQGIDAGTGSGLASAVPPPPLNAQLPKARGGAVNHAPTDAQKSAGNYAKRKMSFQGIPITIENELGSTRSGRDDRGRAWSCKLPADYGYIRGTEGADGDHVDCYVGPASDSSLVVVVNQRHPDGAFDEHKCLLGFPTERAAIDCYVKAFSDGKGADRIKSIEVMSVDAFRKWLRHGKTTKPANGRSIVDRALQLVHKGASAP